jgi:hypothetical protein
MAPGRSRESRKAFGEVAPESSCTKCNTTSLPLACIGPRNLLKNEGTPPAEYNRTDILLCLPVGRKWTVVTNSATFQSEDFTGVGFTNRLSLDAKGRPALLSATMPEKPF